MALGAGRQLTGLRRPQAATARQELREALDRGLPSGSAIAGSPAGASSPRRWAIAGSTARKRSVEATATPSRCGQPICSSRQASETTSQTQPTAAS